MPKFIVDVDGQKYAVEADSQPTPDEVRAHLGNAPVLRNAPVIGLNAPPKLAPQESDTPTFLNSLVKTPGTGESLAALPVSLVDLLPGGKALKPFTVPAAGLLGATGEGAEQLLTGKPFNISDIVGAGVRQGGLELAGRGLEAGARPIMSLFGLPGAKKAAVTAALDEGIGRNLDKSRAVAADLANAVRDRVSTLPDVPLDEILQGVPARINREVSQSTLPISTHAALTDAEQAIRAENAPILSALETQAKKQGAGRGYELVDKKIVNNREITPTTLLQEEFRRGAKDALDARDAAALASQGIVRRTITPSLPQLNERLGNVSALTKYLDPAQEKELGSALGLASRAALGAAVGGGASRAAGGDYLTDSGVAALSALMAANPTAAANVARLVRAAGQTLPPLTRGTTAVIGSIRRKTEPDDQ